MVPCSSCPLAFERAMDEWFEDLLQFAPPVKIAKLLAFRLLIEFIGLVQAWQIFGAKIEKMTVGYVFLAFMYGWIPRKSADVEKSTDGSAPDDPPLYPEYFQRDTPAVEVEQTSPLQHDARVSWLAMAQLS